jgi:DHA1 family inner membrane transport protein
MAILTAGFERKTTLIGLMALFVIGNVLCALAPSYGWLMAARVVVSLSHGACLGIATVVAANLVAEERRAGAVSLVLAGITVANIVGVPIGTAIGGAFGWRATFWVVSLLGVVAAAGAAVWVPRAGHGASAGQSLMAEIRVLGRQDVYLSLAAIIVAAAGFFALFAYIAPLLTDVVGVSASALPAVLAVFGVGALIGNLAGGRLADWKLMPSIIGIFVVLFVIYVLLLGAVHGLVLGVATLFVWAIVNFSFAAPLQTRILNGARAAPTLASTLVSTAFNIGIASGAAIGSVALTRGLGYDRLPLLGIVGIIPALVLVGISHALDRRAARPA